jgi:nitrogen regulatory protein PII
MKILEATVRPIAFGAVKRALQTLRITVLTVSRVEELSNDGATHSVSQSAVEIADGTMAARARCDCKRDLRRDFVRR